MACFVALVMSVCLTNKYHFFFAKKFIIPPFTFSVFLLLEGAFDVTGSGFSLFFDTKPKCVFSLQIRNQNNERLCC